MPIPDCKSPSKETTAIRTTTTATTMYNLGYSNSNNSGSRHSGGDNAEHLHRCWHLTNCKDCLSLESDCSWCPFSWTCVPNPNGKLLAFLAPAWDEDVCPHWAERWELRTRPLGCQVSTITTLTSLVTIGSTLALVLLGFAVVFGARRVGRRCKGRRGRVQKRDSSISRLAEGGAQESIAGAAGGDTRLEGDARHGSSHVNGTSGSISEGIDGLISRLRMQKSKDDAARKIVVADDAAAREAQERVPLLEEVSRRSS